MIFWFVYFFSHWWGFQLEFEIFEEKKETLIFVEYIEGNSWDNPTTFLTCFRMKWAWLNKTTKDMAEITVRYFYRLLLVEGGGGG